jgi:diketogulonate reductase-like aldo/keto reductase
MQVAIAWTMRLPGVVTIPKAVRPDHVRADVAAASLALSAEDLEELDRAHPVPERDIPLETA